MAFFGASQPSQSGSSSTTGDLKNDVEVNAAPEDGISEIQFSSVADYLAVSSWDRKVRVYEIAPTGQSQGKFFYEHDGPVLSCCWSKDGTKLASAGADRAVKLYDVQSAAQTQVGQHDSPIRTVRFVDVPNANSMLVTGSWDKTIRYWDVRQQHSVATVHLPERVYSMDVQQQLLVLGLAERHVCIVNLSNPTVLYKSIQSPLKWQTRVVSCFPNATGFAIGSTEGRCAIQYVEEKDTSLNFSFKCHRETPPNTRDVTNVFSVNAISFHPTYGTFSTAGSDGTFHFWDKDAKHRLKGYPSVGGTISATSFNRSGSIFAYAISYDWSKGFHGNQPDVNPKLMLHAIREDEAKPRSIAKKR